VTAAPGGLASVLKADGQTAKVGYADNLVVEAFVMVARKRPDGTELPERRVSWGVLPAVSFEIVQP